MSDQGARGALASGFNKTETPRAGPKRQVLLLLIGFVRVEGAGVGVGSLV